jgi:hypothetical protein
MWNFHPTLETDLKPPIAWAVSACPIKNSLLEHWHLENMSGYELVKLSEITIFLYLCSNFHLDGGYFEFLVHVVWNNYPND